MVQQRKSLRIIESTERRPSLDPPENPRAHGVELRVAWSREAQELEAAGADWKIKHVMAVLGCARSTVYETTWLMRISRRVGKNGRRWMPREVRNAQEIASGHLDLRTLTRARR